MLGLVAAGTLGYLPVNLRDVARAIDSRRRRRRGPGRGRGRGGRQRRAAAAGTGPHTLEQLLLTADPDRCVLRLICEAEFVGARRAASAEERLVHHLFGAGPGRRPPLPAPMERAARRGRQARLRAAPSARCHLLSPRCRASPLEAVRRGTGVRSVRSPGSGHRSGHQCEVRAVTGVRSERSPVPGHFKSKKHVVQLDSVTSIRYHDNLVSELQECLTYTYMAVMSITENRNTDTKPNTNQNRGEIPKPNQLGNMRKIPTF
ncbi:hypothetical protein FJT64_018750 [Amphibalanus amphitrite]|uniref:Uncharacterized protein n=1 Tax=Amphibalanus amphitrite TaxID=1232801 RepID=A0A6A4X5K8_AMPAM|nr:hypothetical protein FJT64_018750 [Amphibalanus amphitrite]